MDSVAPFALFVPLFFCYFRLFLAFFHRVVVDVAICYTLCFNLFLFTECARHTHT